MGHELPPPPHLVLVPFVAQGHIIPMVDVAHLLADRGARITLATTKLNLQRNHQLLDGFCHCVELPFPSASFGLPDGCDNMDVLGPGSPLVIPFFDALDALTHPLEAFLRTAEPRPDCVVADSCAPWAAAAARRLGIPTFVFHGPSAFFLLATHNLALHDAYALPADDFAPLAVPDFPAAVETNRATGRGFFHWPGFEKLRREMLDAEVASQALIMNTFYDLERPFIDGYAGALNMKKIFPVGPVCLRHTDAGSKAARGNRANVDCEAVVNWLDSKESHSVLYVSFGSIMRAGGAAQMIELGAGLEASCVPFVWVIKLSELADDAFAGWLSPGFEDRVAGRGIVIKGWAPQVLILTHPAVGGFVTHCGWNSTLESIAAGMPMLTWPCLADQFLNEKLVVEVLGVGVSLGVKKPMTHRAGEKDVSVRREDLSSAIAALMGSSPEGDDRRKKVKDLASKAKAAMEEGGSSSAAAADLIRYVWALKCNTSSSS